MSFEVWILVIGVLVGVSCVLIGIFFVLRKMVMLVDVISYIVLLGIVCVFFVIGSFDGIFMFIGVVVFGLLMVFLV